MKTVEERAEIRRQYYNEKKSMREIAREMGCARKTVKKALESAGPVSYQKSRERAAPVLGAYRGRIEEMLAENERLPHKQRYTSRRIYEMVREEGYEGSESGVRRYVGERRRERRKRQVYLKLEFDPGQDAQVDWGEGEVIVAGEQVTVQLFVMRLGYSRRIFVKAYPTQRQECFLDGHVRAFEFYGGVPQCIAYDNLKVAVYEILTGRHRREQEAFTLFRSHYLFDSRYCTPGQGHEKGGVEHGVGYARRKFLVPLPEVSSYDELNSYLLESCLAQDSRVVDGQPRSIGQMWAEEQPYLRPLPNHELPCCVTREVALNPYCQVVFETNRYSVPTDRAYPTLTLRAFPFAVEVLHGNEVLARHPRSYEREQDVIDPLHYLPLLAQRPGAFEHAQPLRRWRSEWPPVYEDLLATLQQRFEHSVAIRQFVQILNLHREHPAEQIEQAIGQVLEQGFAHLEGIEWCLRQSLSPQSPVPLLDLSGHPHLAGIGHQPLDLSGYDQLLAGGSRDN
jgi:transposase